MIRLLILFFCLVYSSNCMARQTLTANDIRLVGAFTMPREVGAGNVETAYGNGLALRRVNGQVRLFSTAYENADSTYPLYEVTIPALKTSAPWNDAPLQKFWGNVLTHRAGLINGLYWDETDQRLYYQTSGNYVASGDVNLPTLAFVTFSQDETTATSYGKWGFSDRGFKKANFGLTAVPSDFATQYLSGKRLASGFGGYQSVVDHGDASFGPALTAHDPPLIGTEGGYLANTPLIGYGGASAAWTTGERPTNSRAWRDDDAIQDIYGTISDPDNSTNIRAYPEAWTLTGDESFYWQGYSITGSSRSSIPNNVTFDNSRIVTKHWEPGNAFWNNDYLHQAGAWIQTTNKEGVLFMPTLSTGHNWYGDMATKLTHDSFSEGIKNKLYIYSREQLASVAQGTVGQNEIQATRYDIDLSSFGITTEATSGLPRWRCTGMAFDSTDNRLYIALYHGSNAPSQNLYSRHLVIVYEITGISSVGVKSSGTTASLGSSGTAVSIRQ